MDTDGSRNEAGVGSPTGDAGASSGVSSPQGASKAARGAGTLLLQKLAAGSTTQKLSIGNGRRASAAWFGAIDSVTAVDKSPHREAIHGIADSQLKGLASSLVTAQQSMEKARVDANASREMAHAELDENYKFMPDVKQPAYVPLARAGKAIARVADASRALEEHINSFMSRSLALLVAAEERRQREITALQGNLQESDEARAKLGLSLASERDAEKMQRLRAALRLTKNWSSAVSSGRHAVDATRTLLLREVSSMEAELAAEVARSQIEREAYRDAIERCEQERASQEAALRAEHAAAAEAQSAEARAAAVSFEMQLEREREATEMERREKEQLQVRLSKTEAEAAKVQSALQSEAETMKFYASRLNKTLSETVSQLKAERAEVEARLEQRFEAHRAQWEERHRALEEEIVRLRKVQVDVLEQGGALPGSAARQFLFYEASKFISKEGLPKSARAPRSAKGSAELAKHAGPWKGPGGGGVPKTLRDPPPKRSALLQPEASISWRGQQQQHLALLTESLDGADGGDGRGGSGGEARGGIASPHPPSHRAAPGLVFKGRPVISPRPSKSPPFAY